MSDRDPIEARVDDFMQRFARLDRHVRLPDPSTIWIRARLLQSEIVAERAARPVTNAQIAAYLVVAAAWAALLMWKWSALTAWLRGLTPSRIVLGAAGAGAVGSLSLTLLAVLAVLASVTLMLAFHTILAEE